MQEGNEKYQKQLYCRICSLKFKIVFTNSVHKCLKLNKILLHTLIYIVKYNQDMDKGKEFRS